MAIREPRPRGKMQKGRRVGASSPSSQQNLEARAREERVLQLRLAGLDFTTIAKEVGYQDKSSAHHALKRAMERASNRTQDLADEYKHLILLRLERLHRSYWLLALGQPERGRRGDRDYQPAQPPNFKACDRVLRMMEREMALLGLEAPRGATPPTSPEDIARAVRETLAGIEDSFEPPPPHAAAPQTADS